MERVKHLVSPKAAVELSEHRGTDDLYIASEIYDTARDYFSEEYNSYKYIMLSSLAAVWNAGRIQGIKEERLKRRKKNNVPGAVSL